MNSFESQVGKDFFAADLSTQPSEITNETCIATAERKLRVPTIFPFSQGAADWSTFDEFGWEEESVNFPHTVELRATTELKQASAAWASGRTDFGVDYFTAMANELLTFNAIDPIPIWEVFANEEPGEDLFLVGNIYATDDFKASTWADEKMYFKHEGWNATLQAIEDLPRRRSWRDSIPTESEEIPWGEGENDIVIDLPEDSDEA